jgi:DNA-binding Lrp family transcriptional regulator
MDDIDRKILASLVEDGRRTLDDVGRDVGLSASAVKRRIDRLRATGTLRGFKAVVDHSVFGSVTEAFIELFFAPGVTLEAVAAGGAAPPAVGGGGGSSGGPEGLAGGGARGRPHR